MVTAVAGFVAGGASAWFLPLAFAGSRLVRWVQSAAIFDSGQATKRVDLQTAAQRADAEQKTEQVAITQGEKTKQVALTERVKTAWCLAQDPTEQRRINADLVLGLASLHAERPGPGKPSS